jgi:hypothetical protein
MAQIIKYNHFQSSSIKCEPVAKNKAGGSVVYLKYNEMKKIVLQTPTMIAPFGLSIYNDEANGVSKYSLDLSFRDKEQDTKIQKFHNVISELDAFMIEKGVENSKEWFGKKMSKEVVEELYRPLIKESKDPSKYASTIKFKIRSSGDRLNLEAFDEQKEKFNMDNFAPGSKARTIIELTSIWFVNKQFGCTFNIIQLQATKPEKISGWAFQAESDEEEETDEEEEEEEEEA